MNSLLAMVVSVALVASNSNREDAGPSSERPNVVLIMADDMGYSDIGCYGGEIRTPNLDALAAGGIRFTQFYNTARCCPTRASLMTGRYAHQSGVGHMVYDAGREAYRGELSRDSVTIAEVLGDNGYATGMSGKWHVTHNLGRPREMVEPEQRTNWPTDRGFDSFYGTIHGAGSFFDPVTLARGDEYIDLDREDFYYTDRINEEAARFITTHAASGDQRPFFLYVAHTAPHWPLHARPEDIERCKGRYDAGWDAARDARYQRMKTMGLIDPDWPMTDRDTRVQAWEDVENRAWQARRMEVYAAQVESMDRGIGLVIDALRVSGQLDDTLVMFLADNGGCAEEIGPNWRSLSIPEKTHDGRPVANGNDPAVMPGAEDNYQSYGVPWANVSNTPFRYYKHHVHEGGIASPLVVHWPERIKAHGEFRHTPGHVIDIMATCLEAAGADYPRSHGNHVIEPMEGTSLLPALIGEDFERNAIFWEHEGNRAVRKGRWKLVSRHNRDWALYDLVADRSETNDLSPVEVDRAAAMIALYEAWALRCGVESWPLAPGKPPAGK